MRSRVKGLIASVAFVSLVAATSSAEASPIVLDGSWTQLIDIMPAGEFFTGKGYGSTTKGGAKTIEWSSPLQVLFKITDLFVVGDQFRLFDKGVALLDVANGLKWQDIPGCHGKHDKDCHWTNDPDEAFSDPVFSKQQIVFAPGDHSVTIQVLSIPEYPGKSGEHNPHYINATAAYSAEALVDAVPTPEPASLVLLGSGLLGVAYRARRRTKNPAA